MGKPLQTTKVWLSQKFRRDNPPPFESETLLSYLNLFLMSYRNFDTQRIFYRADIGKSHKWKSQKNRFFENGLKYDLNALGYRFVVQNTSKTPKGSISAFPAIYHHSDQYRPLYRRLNFCQKSRFGAFWGIFSLSKYDRPCGWKWSKSWLVAGNCPSGPPKHLYIPWMTFYDH